MPSDPAQYRKKRIERLLEELRYEVTRGMMENEIEEEIGFQFVVPLSRRYRRGVVFCEFVTQPLEHFGMAPTPPDHGPHLKLVPREEAP